MNLNNTSSGKQYNNVGGGSQYNAENITIHHAANDSGDKDRQFFIDLKLSDPRLDKERIERTKGGLLKDSYVWILNNEDFQRWRANFRNQLLWIRGDPGKGKTMLLCGIVNELDKEKSTHQPIYFFCQATDSNLNTASAVLRGILYLMLKKKPQLIKDLRKTHDYGERQLFEGSNGWNTLCDMVISVLAHESFQNTVIVIDALDECKTGVDDLLDFIHILSSKAVRIIISSRNWPRIERGVAAAAQRAAHVSLELNEDSISAAVVAFIEHKVSQLAQKHEYSDTKRDLVYNTLVQNSNSTFLWAALVCQQLAHNNINDWEVESKLAEFPPGLDVLYTRMLHHALSSTNVDLVRRILAVASVVFRPVEITELRCLLGPVRNFVNNERSLEEAVKLCGSFVTIRDNVVYFVHQSAKDFLLENTVLGKVMPQGIRREHQLLWMNSVKAMASTFRYNIYDLETPGTSIEHAKVPTPDPLAPVRYACIHWIDHFSMTTWVGRPQDDQMKDIFKHSFLHWAEAVCLLRSIHEVVESMVRLSESIKDIAEFSKLTALIQDASRFLQQHRQVIEKTPLQIYWSVILFSPRKSLIRKLCLHKVQNWFLTKPLVEEDHWNTYRQVLGYHRHCNALKFSPEGHILASKSSDDIKLWAVMTGRCLTTIRLPGMASAQMTFSYNALIVATVIEESECMIWNTKTGKCLQKFQLHSGKIECVALSPDGCTLAMGSSDATVRLWDTETGRCRVLEGHESPVVVAEFSPDGRTLASAATSVKIWSVETGEFVQDMGWSGRISSIRYAQNGRRIIFITNDKYAKDVTVCETSTGVNIKSFPRAFGREAQISSQVVASDQNFTNDLVIWSVETGKQLGTIPNSEVFVGMALSNDGDRLATAAIDGIISLWDLTAHLYQRNERKSTERLTRSGFISKTRGTVSNATSGKHREISTKEVNEEFSPVQSVNFSVDCQRIVSVRQGCSPVEVWETRSGRRLQKLHVHVPGTSEPVYIRAGSTAAFSEENRILLAVKGDFEVNIWDATGGSYVKSLRGCGPVYAVVFSGDAKRLAISSQADLDAIQIWSLEKGQCIWKLKFPEETLSPMLSQLGYLHFWFSQSESELYTRLGTIDLSMLTSQETASWIDSKPKGYFIEEDWIMKDEAKIIWLPEEYRPWRDRFAVRDSALAIGCKSGRVVIIQFA